MSPQRAPPGGVAEPARLQHDDLALRDHRPLGGALDVALPALLPGPDVDRQEPPFAAHRIAGRGRHVGGLRVGDGNRLRARVPPPPQHPSLGRAAARRTPGGRGGGLGARRRRAAVAGPPPRGQLAQPGARRAHRDETAGDQQPSPADPARERHGGRKRLPLPGPYRVGQRRGQPADPDRRRAGPAQPVQEHRRRGTQRGIAGQAVRDEAAQERVGDPVQVRVLVQHPVDQDLDGPVAEHAMPEDGEPQHRAEREDVARRAHLLAGGLLGRHVAGCSQHPARTGQRVVVGRPGDAEVDDPRALTAEQHIGRLQVAVDDAGPVDGVQPFRQPCRQRQGRLRRERPVRLDRLLERQARQVGGGQPRHGRVGVGLQHGRGERAAHQLGVGDLAPEAGPEPFVAGVPLMDHLDGDRGPGGGAAEVDLAHATGPEPCDQHMVTDARRVFRGQRFHSINDARRRPGDRPPSPKKYWIGALVLRRQASAFRAWKAATSAS